MKVTMNEALLRHVRIFGTPPRRMSDLHAYMVSLQQQYDRIERLTGINLDRVLRKEGSDD